MKKLIIKGMDRRYFSGKVVDWYQQHKRPLPWRETKDPYKIWLSEIILQQTRVAQGLPYYERFVATHPTVSSLASAPEQEILRLWQGLGYYTRARNLHKCARTVVEQHDGKFPGSFGELKNLPGVGDYTAAAIASIAFREPVAVVDGNVFRVLSRIFGIDTPINSPAGKKIFTSLANELTPRSQPDIHNQAVMEFGATFCTPVNPSCDTCIFARQCVAKHENLQQHLPVKVKKTPSRKRYFHYLVFSAGNNLLMRKRSGKDIWFGLYDFPLVEGSAPLQIENLLEKNLGLKKRALQKVTVTDTYKHILTHQTIFCRFVIIPEAAPPAHAVGDSAFYTLPQILDLPKPALVSRFLDDYSFYS